MRKVVLLFAVIVAGLFSSCEVKIPEYVMSPKKMESFLYDYHLVQAMSGQYSGADFKGKLYFGYVFNKHGVTKERFDSSMLWYTRYPKHLKRIYENLEVKLDKELELLNNARATLEEGVSLDVAYLAEDSADVWTSAKIKQLTSTPLNSRVAFSFDVPEDTTFVKGDSLSFSFTAYFIPSDSVKIVQGAYSAVKLEYEDGTVFTKGVMVETPGEYDLFAPRYFSSKLRSMSGFIYYFDNDSTVKSRLLLGDLSVVRIHPKKDNKAKKRR